MSITPLAKDDVNKPEFALLILLALVGMMLMIPANDLMSLYMAVELQSLSAICCCGDADQFAAVIETEFGNIFYLARCHLGCCFMAHPNWSTGLQGTTNFDGIAAAVSETRCRWRLFFRFLVFMISGLAFRVSAATFHMWTPDVYEGSPSPVTALFAIAQKLLRLLC